MIFRPELAKLILEGRKTMTLRSIVPGERTCRYHENRVYSIEREAGKLGVGCLTVLQVERVQLGAVTVKDARRLGYRFQQDIIDCWTELHGGYDPELDVWAIGFIRDDHQVRERYLAATPSTQHCTAVLSAEVLTSGRRIVKRCGRAFMDGEKVCRCGARRPDEKMDDHGYTTLAHKGLKGEKAAIPADLQERYAKQARERHEARKKRELGRRRRLSVAERLRLVEEQSQRLGVDISSETRLIEQRAARAERQLANPSAD